MENINIKEYLIKLSIYTKDQLLSHDIDYWWAKKFKEIQSKKKFTSAKKEALLIELNEAKDKLDAFEIEELLKILPSSRKKLNNSHENNYKEQELINNKSDIGGGSKLEKRNLFFITSLFASFIFFLGILINDKNKEYSTSNNKIEKNNLKNETRKITENKIKKNSIKTINYSNGDKYVGNLINSQRNGYGTYYFSNGDRYEGRWLDNEKNGYGTEYYSNGDKYVGNHLKGTMHGYGTLYFEGNKYEGNFTRNELNGFGKLSKSNGEILEGNWVYGKPKGLFKYTDTFGKTFERKL